MPGKKLRVNFFNIVRFFFILIVVGVLGLFLYFPPYSRYKRLSNENFAMTEKIGVLQKEIEKLEYNIKTVEENPFLLEKIARESIGVARKGEIVIDIRD